jgi:hypothetical protein
MTHLPLLRLSLLSLVLVLPGLAAAAPPAAPPATAPAASADPQQAEAEKQERANAEKKKKAEAEKQKKVDTEKQKQTIADIRNLGTALYSWLTDQVEAAVAEQEAEKQTENRTTGEAPPRGNAEDTRQKTLDIQDNPLISRDDLEDLLVPQYVAAIPETDAWGNPYEVRLNTDNPMAKTVMSIRSPGRKGYYAGDEYKVEGFDPSDFDQDIVWVDGYFARWPQAGTPANKPLPIPPSGRK